MQDMDENERQSIKPEGQLFTKCNLVNHSLRLQCGCGMVLSDPLPDMGDFETTQVWEEELKQWAFKTWAKVQCHL